MPVLPSYRNQSIDKALQNHYTMLEHMKFEMNFSSYHTLAGMTNGLTKNINLEIIFKLTYYFQYFVDAASIYSGWFLHKGAMINKNKSHSEMLKH